MGEKKRLAVLVGCNYANTKYELHGCINDVLAIRKVLLHRFGFTMSNIELLTDEPSSPVKPTGANIQNALTKMIDQLQPGDLLFFHYSGHGTRIPSVKSAHPSRKDEAIVPCDFNLITDLDFRKLVNRVPKGANFTIISDSCHSGGLIDQEKEQIGPSSANYETKPLSLRPRTIPFESVFEQVSSLTNIDSLDIGTHLVNFFGNNASLRFRSPQLHLKSLESSKPDDGILLSGCQADETSADMSPEISTEGKSYGAFSNAIEMVLKEHPGPLRNKELVLKVRKLLKEQGFEQHPCLYCSDQNADATFLWQLKD